MRVGADRREIIEISDALTGHLVTPPDDGVHVCPRCHTWSGAASILADASNDPLDDRPGLCENCREITDVLGTGPLTLSLGSLYRKPSELRDWLTRYKGRDDQDDPFDPACFDKVRAILGRLLLEHGEQLEVARGPLDGVTIVPSTSRQGPHPLEQVVSTLDLDIELLHLLERGPGELGFRRPHPEGYIALGRPSARVLLVDDVYTTGARLNSAALALTRAGHEVVAALVLARRVNPGYAPAAQALWDSAAARRYDWRRPLWN